MGDLYIYPFVRLLMVLKHPSVGHKYFFVSTYRKRNGEWRLFLSIHVFQGLNDNKILHRAEQNVWIKVTSRIMVALLVWSTSFFGRRINHIEGDGGGGQVRQPQLDGKHGVVVIL